MALTFTLAPGELLRVLIKKVGKGKQAKRVAVVLRLVARVNIDVLDAIDANLADHLFNGSRVRFPMLGPQRWGGQIQHLFAVVSDNELRDCTLTDLTFSPFIEPAGDDIRQRVELEFRLQFYPEGNQIAVLSEMTGCDVNVSLAPDDLFTAQESKP